MGTKRRSCWERTKTDAEMLAPVPATKTSRRIQNHSPDDATEQNTDNRSVDGEGTTATEALRSETILRNSSSCGQEWST